MDLVSADGPRSSLAMMTLIGEDFLSRSGRLGPGLPGSPRPGPPVGGAFGESESFAPSHPAQASNPAEKMVDIVSVRNDLSLMKEFPSSGSVKITKSSRVPAG